MKIEIKNNAPQKPKHTLHIGDLLREPGLYEAASHVGTGDFIVVLSSAVSFYVNVNTNRGPDQVNIKSWTYTTFRKVDEKTLTVTV